MNTLRHDTPAGPLTMILDGDVVRAAGFTHDADGLARRMGLAAAPPPMATHAIDGLVQAWLDGDLAALDRVVVKQEGTDFQQRVWAALQAVPPGRTTGYADLAVAVGRPAATRAVGSACGRNLLAPFVPCHRAIRRDGGLGGYAYGLPVKAWLIAHEGGHL